MTKQGLKLKFFVLTNLIFVTDFWKGINRSVILGPISSISLRQKTLPTDSLQVDSLIAKISSKGQQRRDQNATLVYRSIH